MILLLAAIASEIGPRAIKDVLQFWFGRANKESLVKYVSLVSKYGRLAEKEMNRFSHDCHYLTTSIFVDITGPTILLMQAQERQYVLDVVEDAPDGTRSMGIGVGDLHAAETIAC